MNKTIIRLISVILILGISSGSFTRALAGRAEDRLFMEKEVSSYKYYFMKDYKNIYYKSLKESGRKYTLSPELAFIDKTLGACGGGYTLFLFFLYNGSMVDEFSFYAGLVFGGLSTFYMFSKKESPFDFRINSEPYEYGLADNYFLEVSKHIITSWISGLYVGATINIFNGETEVNKGVMNISMGAGILYGVLTTIIGMRNLENMQFDTERRLGLYPNIMYVNENEPVMTMNLAYRF